jgi:hypothetical protein
MEKGRRFWLARWELFEIVEVANWIWPEAFLPEELAA